ncbi:MAG: hypothetical protein Q4F84_10760 [Fibrobacter sp.]|nr:hypothetical protein [Fibrobacter sp.]
MKNLFSLKTKKLLGISIALLVIGYFLLAQKPVENPMGLTVAPLILVGVYCILIPCALACKGNSSDESKQS